MDEARTEGLEALHGDSKPLANSPPGVSTSLFRDSGNVVVASQLIAHPPR